MYSVAGDVAGPETRLDGGDKVDGEWSVDELLTSMGERWNWWWIKDRIRRTWSDLETAGLTLRGGQKCSEWTGRRRKVSWSIY